MTITASSVKDLREKTGAGMMECKKALEESAGDIDSAVKWLREKGLANAAKKAGRAAAEGLVGLKTAGSQGVLVEVNCETDFVARTDDFKGFLSGLTEQALTDSKPGDAKAEAEALSKLPSKKDVGRSVEESLKAVIGKLGENMQLSRVAKLEVVGGVVGSYLHSDGKLGALVGLKCGKSETAAKPEMIELAKNLAMQVAGHMPPAEVLSREQISPELIAREREIAVTQAKATGKPDAMIEKIADGKVNKVLQEITLLEQIFIMDGKLKVADLIKQAAAKVGDSVEIASFVRLKVGVGA